MLFLYMGYGLFIIVVFVESVTAHPSMMLNFLSELVTDPLVPSYALSLCCVKFVYL